jgi:ferritin-like metal-binding protein YciE
MTTENLKNLEETLSMALDDIYHAEEGINLLADHLRSTEQPHGDHAVRMHGYIAESRRKLEDVHEAIEHATMKAQSDG